MKWDNIRDAEYRTKEATVYKDETGFTTVIPRHAKCIPATNLPNSETDLRYWVEGWEGMSDADESWARNYGFLLDACEVETC